ncbi:hypothetical protein JCM10207_001404 [Rhodosporidiobolus poonsookiae]
MLTLRHLTLFPTPIDSVPDPNDPAFDQQLVDEARQLLELDAWTDKKAWHGGIVDTFVLPQGSVSYEPAVGGAAAGPSPTGQSGDEGILWHKRVSRFKAREHGEYETWWAALGDNHVEQEQQFVDNLVQVVDIGKAHGKKDCFLKLYKLPFGATDRSFMCHSVTCSPTDSLPSSEQPAQSHESAKASGENPNSKDTSSAPKGQREFLVFSLPVETPAAPKEEKKYVRGTQATIERVREVDGGDIEWSCASLSTPGGSIPVKLSESKMSQTIADAVPSVLAWMAKAHPPSASSSGVKTGTYTADSAPSAQNPTKPRVTSDLDNPGGGMGRMPAGKLPLHLFQQEVPLREY